MKFIVFLLTLFTTLLINGQTLMINEISQGSGSSEYVELVVAGTPCSEGVYTYIVKWKDLKGYIHQQTGQITLIR